MSDKELADAIVNEAINGIAATAAAFIKKCPPPNNASVKLAAYIYVRTCATACVEPVANPTNQQHIACIAASTFLVEHIDEIVAKVVELEGGQTTVTE